MAGVESQQLGVDDQEGVQGLLASACRAGVDSLDDMPLQSLYAQLTELRVNQPLHSLHSKTLLLFPQAAVGPQ